jgi:hypothetical protein
MSSRLANLPSGAWMPEGCSQDTNNKQERKKKKQKLTEIVGPCCFVPHLLLNIFFPFFPPQVTMFSMLAPNAIL